MTVGVNQVGGAGHADMEQLEPGVNISFLLKTFSSYYSLNIMFLLKSGNFDNFE